jgi:TatD DNase family protein
MNTIDTHSHFNLHQFDEDREESIARMEASGVGTICIGVDAATSELAVKLAHTHESIWSCVGQHPTEWEKEFDEALFEKLVTEKRVVAVGECGLDYYREKDRGGVAEQKELFSKQIALAHKHNLPLMLHIRPTDCARQGLAQTEENAYEDALAMLEAYKEKWPEMQGTAHFFAGSKEIAQRFLDLGFYISFSGVITFVKEYEETVRFVPLDRILPETDAPFAAPAPYRGTRSAVSGQVRNQPEYVLEVVRKIAEIKGLSFEETEQVLRQNVTNLFGV